MRFTEDDEQHYKITYVIGITDEDWRAIGGSLAHFMAKDVEYPYKVHLGLTSPGTQSPPRLGKLILGAILQDIFSRRVPIPEPIYNAAIDNPVMIIAVEHLDKDKMTELCKKEETVH